MAVVSMKELLESGVHFGHQTRRWNPKMKKYIFTERNGIYIIDLQKTLRQIEAAYRVVRQAAENDRPILFVGTKKQARDVVTIRFSLFIFFAANRHIVSNCKSDRFGL